MNAIKQITVCRSYHYCFISLGEEDPAGASDSDGAPDDVLFSHSKEAVLRKVKDTMMQIQQAKNKDKERRRKKDQVFKAQKVGWNINQTGI